MIHIYIISMIVQYILIIGIMGNECISSGPPAKLIQSAFVDFQQDNLPRSGHFNFAKQSTFNKIEAASRKFCINNQIDQNYVPIIARLLAYNHHHYFNAFKNIPLELREKFVEHLSALDIPLMDSLYNHFIVMEKRHVNPFETIFNANIFIQPPSIKFNSIKYEHIQSSQEIGRKLLTSKKVAVMLMIASNQQTSQHTSKALQTISIEGASTRLQLMLNRLRNNITSPKIFRTSITRDSVIDNQPNREELNRSLEIVSQIIIIACNQNNQKTINSYLSKNQWFGFDQKLIKIIPIRNLPIINEQGKICLNFEFKTLVHPQGSAKCLQLLLNHQNHLRGFFKYHQLQYLHVLDCQNIMQCPADSVFIGMASRFQRSIMAKCIPPQSLYQNRMRYVQSQNRLHLLSLKELQYINDLDLLKTAPVALNSMVFQVSWLLDLIDNYDVEIALSRRYHPKEIYCNYYDFVKNMPVVGAKCYAFQKDLKDYICTTPKAQLIQYDRSFFSQSTEMVFNHSLKSFIKKQVSI